MKYNNKREVEYIYGNDFLGQIRKTCWVTTNKTFCVIIKRLSGNPMVIW